MTSINIGIIGCGNISSAYLRTVNAFPVLKCVALADVDVERAKSKAAEFGVANADSVSQILDRKEVDLIVNLTTPQSHYEIAMRAIESGKHVYNEKPLTVTVEQARTMLDAADKANVRIGCAPGTFIGAGLQTCRALIDAGEIGEPIAASAFMMCRGHESWHPDPEFYYKVGGGPMMDMGPYYITALISLLGGIERVSGSASVAIPQRTITSQQKHGQLIDVETPDHIAGVIDFASGAIATIVTSFAIMHSSFTPIQIFGTEGTLWVPDPNSLGGPVKIQRAGENHPVEVELSRSHSDGGNQWGIGVADLAQAILSGRPHRASGDLAFQVLRTMHGFLDSAKSGVAVNIGGSPELPAPVPAGLSESEMDD